MEQPELVDGGRSVLQLQSNNFTDADVGARHGVSTASSSNQSHVPASHFDDGTGVNSRCVGLQPPQPQEDGLGGAASPALSKSQTLLLRVVSGDSEAEDELAPFGDVLRTCLTARVPAEYRLTSQAVTRFALRPSSYSIIQGQLRFDSVASCMPSKLVHRMVVTFRMLCVPCRLLLQHLHLVATLRNLSQVFFLVAGDWASSYVEQTCTMGSRTGSLTAGSVQRLLEETIKAMLRSRPSMPLESVLPRLSWSTSCTCCPPGIQHWRFYSDNRSAGRAF